MIDKLKSSLAAAAQLVEGKADVSADEAKARFAALNQTFTDAVARWNESVRAAYKTALNDLNARCLPFLNNDRTKLHNIERQMEDNLHHLTVKWPRMGTPDMKCLVLEVENFIEGIETKGKQIGLTESQLRLE
jgi:hypothetical protein